MINNFYNKHIDEVRKVFDKKTFVQFHGFLDNKDYNKIFSDINKVKSIKKYDPMLFSYNLIIYNNKDLVKEVNNFVYNLLRKNLKLISFKTFCLERGDYVILNDKINEKKGIKLIIELTKNWNEQNCGYISFVKNNSELVKIKTLGNCATIIKTDENMRSFIKYINHNVKNKKIFMEFIWNTK